MDESMPPFILDRPPSPPNQLSRLSGQEAADADPMTIGCASAGARRSSPCLPANPPPTPETPSLTTPKRQDPAPSTELGYNAPLSPPPSPPPDLERLRPFRPFHLSETLVQSKRQAALIHGEWSCHGHVALPCLIVLGTGTLTRPIIQQSPTST